MRSIVATFAIFMAVLAKAQCASVITNIVVLMMENRSFDHLLGWLKADYNSKIEGLAGGESCPRDPNDASKGSVPVTRNGYDISPDDPKHGFDDIAVQINSNGMDGFVLDAINNVHNETNPVSMFDSTSAPIINQLAQEFAVFDRWHCSIPGPTDPNRAFAMSGTSEGILTNYNGTMWTQQSYFDYLRQHNRSWAGYFQKDPWALFYFEDTNKPENSQYLHELDQRFWDDVAAGQLPNFTWLQPQTTTYGNSLCNWQHPDASVIEGEKLIKKVYEALRASPQWESTLFLITYDEHGGFYDHVVPPHVGVPGDGQVADNGFTFDQLGIRIPTLAISPWIKKGTIVSEALAGEKPTPTSQFDSTSIMATANKLLGLADEGAKPLTNRMAWANTFAGLVGELSEPRTDCPTTLKDLPASPAGLYDAQRLKPLNEHLEAQLIFYCVHHYAAEHAAGACPGRLELMHNQGLASDWIQAEASKYLSNLKAQEAVYKQKLAGSL